MGFYNKDGKWQHEPMDAGAGMCSEDQYLKQQQEIQKKLDKNNAGELGSPIRKIND